MSWSLQGSANTALHLAASSGRPGIAAILAAELRRSCSSLDMTNKNGDTPLMFACAKGHAGIAATLLKVRCTAVRHRTT